MWTGADADMARNGKPLILATDLTIAWLSNPNTRVSALDVPQFLLSTCQAITDLMIPPADPPASDTAPHFEAAVSIRKSLASPERIISMIDGKPYMSLARHLKVHGLTPDEYRARYGLRSDYPMVAPAYSAARRAMALKIGLGGKAAAARAAAAASAADETPRTRKSAGKKRAPVTG